jgi:hypothetical protein
MQKSKIVVPYASDGVSAKPPRRAASGAKG